MNTIKKVSLNELGKNVVKTAITEANKTLDNSKKISSIVNTPYIEEIPIEFDEPIQYGEIEKITKPQSDEERAQAVADFIEEQKDFGTPTGILIAKIAKIASLPERHIVQHEKGEGEWYAAGKREKDEKTLEFLGVHDLAKQIRIDNKEMKKSEDFAYGSCAQAAAAVIITTYDEKFPTTDPGDQFEYLKKSNKWAEKNVDANGKTTIKEGLSWDNYDIKPGDVIITEEHKGTQHVMIYVGKEDGIPAFYEAKAHASDDSLYPIITRQPIVDDHKNGITTDPENTPDRQYHVFRPTM